MNNGRGLIGVGSALALAAAGSLFGMPALGAPRPVARRPSLSMTEERKRDLAAILLREKLAAEMTSVRIERAQMKRARKAKKLANDYASTWNCYHPCAGGRWF